MLSQLLERTTNDAAAPGEALTSGLILLAAFFTVAVYGAVVLLCWRYHKSRRFYRSNPPLSSWKLETAWIGIPLVMGVAMFCWSASLFFGLVTPPRDASEIYVVGKQWMWKVYHPDGANEVNELHVPKGRPVVLILSSEDVIHDFAVPAFRIKMDVVPGRFTRLWFRPTETGSFWIFCAQYCGADHSLMRGRVTVMEPAEYDAWAASTRKEGTSILVRGEAMFAKQGCAGCHTDSGEKAPPLLDLASHKELLDDGELVAMDDNYLRESILYPGAKLVKGYPAVMPSFQGAMSEDDLVSLIAYIKSRHAPGAPNRG